MPVIHRSSQTLLEVAEIAVRSARDNPAAANRWLELIDEKFHLSFFIARRELVLRAKRI